MQETQKAWLVSAKIAAACEWKLTVSGGTATNGNSPRQCVQAAQSCRGVTMKRSMRGQQVELNAREVVLRQVRATYPKGNVRPECLDNGEIRRGIP